MERTTATPNTTPDIDTDVLVIGAGPAGSIAAAVIKRAGFNVHVVEKEKFPRFVIGESLLPRCMEVLDDAGLLECIKAQGFQQKFGAKFLKGDMVTDFNFSDQFSEGWTWTWQVPRADFDIALAQSVAGMGVPVDFETAVTAIEFDDHGHSCTSIRRHDGQEQKINAKFIVDASGYGRVIPRLFNLDRPSNLEPRKAVFAHVEDKHRDHFDEPNRIIVVIYQPGVWVWIIPFSNGLTSVGFVGNPDFFNDKGDDQKTQFRNLIDSHPYLNKRFGDQAWAWEPRKLEAWSTTTEKFYGSGFVLTGNVTEFLDPIFSSGVMFAAVSSHLAAKLVVRQLSGEKVNWDEAYVRVIQQGVDTFRSYVMSWYDGTLEKIFFAKNPDKLIKKQICSVLAGYVWDGTNPYVRNHDSALQRLSKMIDYQNKIKE